MAVLPGQRRELPNLRRMAHCVVAALLHYSGILSFYCWIQRRILKRHQVIVLGFHRILTAEQCAGSFSEPAMIMLLSTFEQLIQMLRNSYRVIAMDELELLPSIDLSRPLCLLTFDDAWRDTFGNVYPLLKKQALPAIVFVPTGLVDKKHTFWVERLSRVWDRGTDTAQQLAQELSAIVSASSIHSLNDAIAVLKTIPAATREEFISSAEARFKLTEIVNETDTFMTWDEVRSCSDVMTVASHTVYHVLLTCERPATVAQEVIDSKRDIEARIEKSVTAFAYPSGAFNELARSAVEQAGYSLAFTTELGRYSVGSDPLAIPRVLLHEGAVTGLTGKFSPAMFHLRLMGWR